MKCHLPLRFLIWLLPALLFACQESPTDSQGEENAPTLPAEEIRLPEGFKAELIYSPSEHEQGSWVSITQDDQGRLITSDQYGYLYRITPAAIGADPSQAKVEHLPVQIGHAQGLLYAFNSLYVSVNSNNGIDDRSSGFYRVIDSDGDDVLDEVQTLKTFEGSGEHGPHAVLLGPDGESLYVIAGNHTDLPEFDTYTLPKTWGEDNLFPVLKDPRGHAASRTAPGGWIAKTDPEGKTWELISAGYRNPYDMAFNDEGELFAFDSDMEWDMGMPWYRPIRVCHVTSGSEFGWRTGSGKFRPYFPDNLPPVVNIGQGSPTGVIYGKEAAFPAKYKKGLFIFDWSFGTIYFVSLEARGSTYVGKKEEFLSGVPLPVADGVFGEDGALYFVSGGRRVSSGLYRVYYEGTPEGEARPIADHSFAEERALRQRLEALHGPARTEDLPFIWQHLDHEDRFIRYAARIALEHQPESAWKNYLAKENAPGKIMGASLALARNGLTSLRGQALTKLSSIAFRDLSLEGQLNLIRAYELIFIRLGAPNDAESLRVIQQLNRYFPSANPDLNRQLAKLLAYLEAPEIVPRILSMMEKEDLEQEMALYIADSVSQRSDQYGPAIQSMLDNFPPTANIAYANYLSHVNKGWRPEDRKKYFQWFYDASAREGGMSYRGFLDQMRWNALAQIPESEKEMYASLAGTFENTIDLSALPQPEGPGGNYDKGEIQRMVGNSEGPRDFEHGQKMYQAALCAACHRMKGEGGNMGPDLTQAMTRFNTWSFLDAIMSPSLEISDQYANSIFTLNNGEQVIGREVDANEDSIWINTNPYDLSIRKAVAKAEIQEEKLSAISPMPPGLFNRLNEEEILDLMAFLQSGGDPSHKYFSEGF